MALTRMITLFMDFFAFVVISPLSSEPFGEAEWKLDTNP